MLFKCYLLNYYDKTINVIYIKMNNTNYENKRRNKS